MVRSRSALAQDAIGEAEHPFLKHGYPYPCKAVHIMPGIFHGDGDASSMVSFGKSLRAVLPWVTNHGGVGMMRKGARITVFCGRSNMSELCNTPVSDWISYISSPEQARQ